MAKPYPIVPADVLDELHALNISLAVYQQMIHHTIRCFCTEGTPSDPEAFLLGLSLIFQPIQDGFLSIESSASMFREMGFVGFGHLADTEI